MNMDILEFLHGCFWPVAGLTVYAVAGRIIDRASEMFADWLRERDQVSLTKARMEYDRCIQTQQQLVEQTRLMVELAERTRHAAAPTHKH